MIFLGLNSTDLPPCTTNDEGYSWKHSITENAETGQCVKPIKCDIHINASCALNSTF